MKEKTPTKRSNPKTTIETINHEKRCGGNYAPKPPITEEARKQRSEAMKDFHRKTGKGTAMGNAQAKRRKLLP
jgi:hypothetical protein